MRKELFAVTALMVTGTLWILAYVFFIDRYLTSPNSWLVAVFIITISAAFPVAAAAFFVIRKVRQYVSFTSRKIMAILSKISLVTKEMHSIARTVSSIRSESGHLSAALSALNEVVQNGGEERRQELSSALMPVLATVTCFDELVDILDKSNSARYDALYSHVERRFGDIDEILLTLAEGEGADKTLRPVYDRSSLALYYWRPKGGYVNFGDEVSRLLVECLIQEKCQRAKVCRPEMGRRKLLATGSILHNARNGDVVWGAGLNGKVGAKNLEKIHELDVRAVRGPLTRDYIRKYNIECPEIYGDPGLLIEPLFGSKIREKAASLDEMHDIVFIPNLNDEFYFEREKLLAGISAAYISPNSAPLEVASIISRAKLVVSSSLHAIIFADSLGVPSRAVLSMFESPLKYMDYFISTGRSDARIYSDVAEALHQGKDLGAPMIDLQPLLDSFPMDLISSESS